MNCVPSLPSPLAHAYLITGGSQEARRTYAEKMAAAYLCTGERPPCGRCRSCEKVGKGIHPDVTLLCPAEGKREIVADQARALRSDAYIRPNEGVRKVYIIDPADTMNPVAPNALLKVLGDGPDYTACLFPVRDAAPSPRRGTQGSGAGAPGRGAGPPAAHRQRVGGGPGTYGSGAGEVERRPAAGSDGRGGAGSSGGAGAKPPGSLCSAGAENLPGQWGV